MNRYAQLNNLVDHVKPTRIIEIGTWNGLRALQMVEVAFKHTDKVHYTGFDLFESGTEEQDSAELNAKKRVPLALVTETLRKGQESWESKGKYFSFDLVKGDTKETLANYEIPEDAFVFIDGGHSVETIRNDFEKTKHCKTVVLDDYYVPDEQGACVDTTKFGCNKAIEGEGFLILPATDPIREGGRVRMVCRPPSAWNGKMQIQVQTRNCVPEENIRGNVHYSTQFIKQWLEECERHDATAIIVSGGPSRVDFLEEIRQASSKPNHYLLCVKTSHDWLISNGIIPWGCLLLDPRPHVLDFIETPHSEVRYITASMVHPVTIDKLVQAKAQMWGYHAFVGNAEAKAIQETCKNAMLLSGGSTAAARGLTVLHAIGFRNFILYGFDSSYPEQITKEQTHGLKKKDPIIVEVEGKKFFTDLELLAQAQDFEKLLKLPNDTRIEMRGDGLIQHMFRTKFKKKRDFTDLFNA